MTALGYPHEGGRRTMSWTLWRVLEEQTAIGTSIAIASSTCVRGRGFNHKNTFNLRVPFQQRLTAPAHTAGKYLF